MQEPAMLPVEANANEHVTEIPMSATVLLGIGAAAIAYLFTRIGYQKGYKQGREAADHYWIGADESADEEVKKFWS
jgi:hypothetical protein